MSVNSDVNKSIFINFNSFSIFFLHALIYFILASSIFIMSCADGRLRLMLTFLYIYLISSSADSEMLGSFNKQLQRNLSVSWH